MCWLTDEQPVVGWQQTSRQGRGGAGRGVAFGAKTGSIIHALRFKPSSVPFIRATFSL